MTSEDVVASLKRWGGYAVQAKALWASVEDVRPAGKYAVELRLKEKSGIVLISLANANNFAAIYPKEIAEKYPTPNKVTEFIGTGPFKFVEWKPDSHIRMVRFDDYKPRAGGAQRLGRAEGRLPRRDPVDPDAGRGHAGRHASSRARWTSPTTSRPTRTTGSRTNPKLKPLIVRPYAWAMAVFNKKEGLMTNQKLRQAIQAAIDIEPVMKGAVGNPLFYRLDPGLSFQEQKAWHSTVGAQSYNQHEQGKGQASSCRRPATRASPSGS